MSFTYGFFNSLNHDRTYSTEEFSEIFNGIINDGVFASIGNAMVVATAGGMQVKVLPGRAWFNGTWSKLDAEYPLTVPAAELVQDRIDAVVLEVNFQTSVRANSLKIVKGTPSNSPSRPVMVNTKDVHQHPLAYIWVSRQTTSIAPSAITNAVGTYECPFVTGILQVASLDTLYARWESEWRQWYNAHSAQFQGDFDSWFQSVKTILESVPTGEIVSSVNKLTNRVFKYTTYTLNANGWAADSGYSGRYSQTISVHGITANDPLEYEFLPPSGETKSIFDSYTKNVGYIRKYVTGANTVTFYCYSKVPTQNIRIRVRGY